MPLFRWNIRLPIFTSVVAHIAVASATFYVSSFERHDPNRRENQIDMVFLPPPVLEVEQPPEPIPEPPAPPLPVEATPPAPPVETTPTAPVPVEPPPADPVPDAVAVPIPKPEPPKKPEPKPEPVVAKPPPEPQPKPEPAPKSEPKPEPEPKPQPAPKPTPPAIIDPPPAPRPDLQKMLKSLIAYPWSASTNCEQRIALVRLTVNAEGWISAYKIIRGTGYGPVDAAIGDNIRRAPRLPLPAGTKLPETSEVIVPVAVTLPDCSDRFAEVEEEGNDGFTDDPGPGDGEVDPMGIGSAALTDQESELGFSDDNGPLDGEVDPAGPGSEELTDQQGNFQTDPFIQPLECTLFGINCEPDETKVR